MAKTNPAPASPAADEALILRARLSQAEALAQHHQQRALALAVLAEQQAAELRALRGTANPEAGG